MFRIGKDPERPDTLWTGLRGRLGALSMGTPLRGLFLVLTGDYRKAMFEWLDLAPGQSVVDIGCGAGYLTRRVAAAMGSGAVHGVDLSEEMLVYFEKAAARTGAGDWVKPVAAPVQELPFADESMDRAVSSALLHELDEPAGAVSEVYRVLRPGGVFCAADFARVMPVRLFIDPGHHAGAHLSWEEDELARLFRAGGFDGVQERRIGMWRLARGVKPFEAA